MHGDSVEHRNTDVTVVEGAPEKSIPFEHPTCHDSALLGSVDRFYRLWLPIGNLEAAWTAWIYQIPLWSIEVWHLAPHRSSLHSSSWAERRRKLAFSGGASQKVSSIADCRNINVNMFQKYHTITYLVLLTSTENNQQWNPSRHRAWMNCPVTSNFSKYLLIWWKLTPNWFHQLFALYLVHRGKLELVVPRLVLGRLDDAENRMRAPSTEITRDSTLVLVRWWHRMAQIVSQNPILRENVQSSNFLSFWS